MEWPCHCSQRSPFLDWEGQLWSLNFLHVLHDAFSYSAGMCWCAGMCLGWTFSPLLPRQDDARAKCWNSPFPNQISDGRCSLMESGLFHVDMRHRVVHKSGTGYPKNKWFSRKDPWFLNIWECMIHGSHGQIRTDRLKVDSAKPRDFYGLVRDSRENMQQAIGSASFARNVVVDKLQWYTHNITVLYALYDI